MKKKYSYFLLLLVSILIFLPSCISSEEVNYLQTINYNYPKQEYQPYRLKPSDQIECAIYTHDKQFSEIFNKVISVANADVSESVSYLIHHNGKILLPYFGEIEVAGLTLEEAETRIQDFMSEAILDVQVTVSLHNNYYYVISDNLVSSSLENQYDVIEGQTAYGGRFRIPKENLTIYQALSQLYTNKTYDLKNVVVTRKAEDGRTIVKTFDLRSKDVVESEFYYVYPNDVYYFPKSSKAFFDMSSFTSAFSTLISPITYLIMVTRVQFK